MQSILRHFYVRICNRRVATIKSTSPTKNLLHLNFGMMNFNRQSRRGFASRCWPGHPFVVCSGAIRFIIGDGPASGFRIDAPMQSIARGHVAGHITDDVMHQHIHVCRRINWCTSLHQHPTRERASRENGVMCLASGEFPIQSPIDVFASTNGACRGRRIYRPTTESKISADVSIDRIIVHTRCSKRLTYKHGRIVYRLGPHRTRR